MRLVSFVHCAPCLLHHSHNMTKLILIIGGTGAQGAAVVRYFSSTGLYEIKCTTRDIKSDQAQELAELSHVTTVPDGRDGHDELALQRALQDIDYVWVNTNGFAIGEQAEMLLGHSHLRALCQSWSEARRLQWHGFGLRAVRLRSKMPLWAL